MSSPLTITATPVQVVPVNNSRKMIFFENVEKEPIYFKKQPLSGAISEVSLTNYDFVLNGAEDNDAAGDSIQIGSICAFRAVRSSAPGSKDGKIAYFEVDCVRI